MAWKITGNTNEIKWEQNRLMLGIRNRRRGKVAIDHIHYTFKYCRRGKRIREKERVGITM